MGLFDRLTRKRKPELPPGVVAYAIGDIHGRLDCLDALISTIAADLEQTTAERRILIFLGDYVDRGPASRGVVDRVLALSRQRGLEVWTLKGNHEEALLTFLDDPAFGSAWNEHGGAAALLSYGAAPPRLKTDEAGWIETHAVFRQNLPPEHLDFYKNLELMRELGDYVFVHAGIRPRRPLDQQTERDLLWIREEFLAQKDPLPGRVIVHGHSPTDKPQIERGRIGVDTGAYATGVLTAVRLEGAAQTLLQGRAGRAQI